MTEAQGLIPSTVKANKQTKTENNTMYYNNEE
jgi:hypothetical protein